MSRDSQSGPHKENCISKSTYPPLTAPTINMRTERKSNITGLPYTKAISIRNRVSSGYPGRLVGRMPMRHEKCLGSNQVGMSAGEDLGG